MVLDLGRDHYHLQGEALTALQEKVRHGNMEDVLKVYEEEMKVSANANAYGHAFMSDVPSRSHRSRTPY